MTATAMASEENVVKVSLLEKYVNEHFNQLNELTHDEIRKFDSVIRNSMYREQGLMDYEQDVKIHLKGAFTFIPYSHDHFVQLLDQAREFFIKQNDRTPETFIDLGCGIGNIMALASKKGFQSSGVEFNDNYVEANRRIFPQHDVMKGNILEWKPKKPYDIAYFYRPLSDTKMWIEFVRNFTTSFPPGQIFISAGGMWEFMTKGSMAITSGIDNIEQLASNIYRLK